MRSFAGQDIQTPSLQVTRLAEARLPTCAGEFRCITYRSRADAVVHLAIVAGDLAAGDLGSREAGLLVRVHSECLTGDVFGSLRCDCGAQLDESLRRISQEGVGVVIYLRGHEGRGIGIAHKIEAYRLQEQGNDTVDANLKLGLPVDSREYAIAGHILADLGVTSVRLLTNNPAKCEGLEDTGIAVVERVPLESHPNPENIGYLRTKRNRMGHLLEVLVDQP